MRVPLHSTVEICRGNTLSAHTRVYTRGVHARAVCICSVHAAFVRGERERGKRDSPFELVSFHRGPDMKGSRADIC